MMTSKAEAYAQTCARLDNQYPPRPAFHGHRPLTDEPKAYVSLSGGLTIPCSMSFSATEALALRDFLTEWFTLIPDTTWVDDAHVGR